MIEVRTITKTYTNGNVETHVLRGVNLTVPDGQFLAIMGKSGAGKSTLMYQMSLLDHPTSGEVVINNVNTAALSSSQRTEFRLLNLGYVFQDYALVPELTALENVMIPLLMRGIEKSIAKEMAQKALGRVGLSHRNNNLPNQMSGGEQQRVSIARAVAPDPDILFADEPTANLDTESSKAVMDIFKELHDDGQTIVMVTHEEEYIRYCDRVVRLSDGQIISDELVS